jgi:VanZ family protein
VTYYRRITTAVPEAGPVEPERETQSESTLSTANATTRQKRARLTRWLLVLFLPVQMMFMHWPLPPLPAGIASIWDKVPHFVLYATLSSLLTWYIVAQRRARGESNASGLGRRLLMGFVCIAAYAWIDELTQPWTGRTCDVYDWFADILGAATVMIGAYLWRLLRKDERAPGDRANWIQNPQSLESVES